VNEEAMAQWGLSRPKKERKKKRKKERKNFHDANSTTEIMTVQVRTGKVFMNNV
jgi:hypothetical protein